VRPTGFDVAGLAAVLGFAALLVADLGDLARPRREVDLVVGATALTEGFREGVRWHALYRKGARVGFARLERRRAGGGYELISHTRMDTQIGGRSQSLEVHITSTLDSAFELERFEAHASGDLFEMRASGRVAADEVEVEVEGFPGDAGPRTVRIPLSGPPVFDFSLEPMLVRHDLRSGDRFSYTHFDPVTLAARRGVIEYLGRDEITVLGELVDAHHLRQEIGGQVFHTWVNDLGEALREELPLGLVAVRETEAEATFGFSRIDTRAGGE
jgi:hypothetical protein